MTNSKELLRDLLQKVKFTTDEDEAKATLIYLLEHRLAISQHDILSGKFVNSDLSSFQADLDRLNQHEPVQYVVGIAYFRNRKFNVNTSVLIPRPETELLVQEVIDEKPKQPVIVDVGSGSGCIAISLALEISGARISTIDVSPDALATARKNAEQLGANIEFHHLDVLKNAMDFSNLDYLVSNPPYVRVQEKQFMDLNVLQYEPHVALFVSDQDPLIFYRVLAENGQKIIKPGGKIIVEINAQLSKETAALFEQQGYQSVQIIHDLEGKERIIKATR